MMTGLILCYIAVLFGLSVYGCLGVVTLILVLAQKQSVEQSFASDTISDTWPSVTVQLPIFNERDVVARLVACTAALDYPTSKLHIQLIDDSTDETTAVAQRIVAQYQAQGVNIELIHRPHRAGYKAGALRAATTNSESQLIAIFDADFCPKPDFLRQTVPHFAADPRLGFVQARWGHLNAGVSALTAAQAIALDEHFMIGQSARDTAQLLPRFNGSGGVWRRSCIDDVGGWLTETVCEDMCLSTRAGLRGWHFRFLPDVVAPAALPTTISAFKNQQARWAKGAVQCVGLYARPILTSPNLTTLSKLHALISMSRYGANAGFMLLFLLHLPLTWFNVTLPAWLGWFSLFGIVHLIALIFPQFWLGTAKNLRHLPLLILIAIGMSPSQIWAMWGVVWGRLCGRSEHPFIRTPKSDHYALPFDWMLLVELGCAAVSGAMILFMHQTNQLAYLPFWGVCLAGFSYLAGLGIIESIQTVVIGLLTKFDKKKELRQ